MKVKVKSSQKNIFLGRFLIMYYNKTYDVYDVVK